MDPAYAARTATGKYRTTPLRGLLQHAPYFHDGSAPDLLAVVDHYDKLFGLNLTAAQKADLVEFLEVALRTALAAVRHRAPCDGREPGLMIRPAAECRRRHSQFIA